ncbi:MAG TPA: RsmD family RNA methyltransferase, partial [Candidatus Sulfotelmatobacter sp.]|nr:RsmD family RNA methyltransferase [Candidatus Sulfotelmatobacter sp.]
AVRSADFVFLDPPYDDDVLDRALKVLDVEVGHATVLAEHSRRQQVPALTRLRLDRQRRYGDTLVSVFRA